MEEEERGRSNSLERGIALERGSRRDSKVCLLAAAAGAFWREDRRTKQLAPRNMSAAKRIVESNKKRSDGLTMLPWCWRC